MYYYGMSYDEIMHHSRRFLHALYKQYIKRACENLGVSPDGKDDPDELSEDDYPTDFGKLQPINRGQPKMEIPDDQLMDLFGDMGMDKYKNHKLLTDK